jgi:hypothetical protein
MTEERITRVEGEDGTDTTTHTTVIHDDRPRSSGAGWVIAIVLVIAVIAGIYLFSQTSGSEIARDNAIAGAAEEVGDAASQVGDAAQQAADSIAN